MDARTLFLTPNTTTVYIRLRQPCRRADLPLGPAGVFGPVDDAEPADFVDPDTVGLYAAIGIRKGAPSHRRAHEGDPDEAAAVGNDTARTPSSQAGTSARSSISTASG